MKPVLVTLLYDEEKYWEEYTWPRPFSTCVVINKYGVAIEARGPTNVHTVDNTIPQNNVFLAPNLPARYPPSNCVAM